MAQKLKKALFAAAAILLLVQSGLYGAETETNGTLPLESEFSILIDANTGHVLHQVGMHQRAYPASMTKVMTALLLLESGRPMDEPIFPSREAITVVMPWHNPLYYVTDYLTVEESLYAIMLPSANCVSNAIAEFLAGSMEEFAMMMTARAHELGAVNTNFTNAHGLWEPDHFTTPYDMALIMREAISHDKFLEIINSQRFQVSYEDYPTEYHMIYNTNRALFPTSQHFNPDMFGGKTGFTNNSRHTLVSYGQRRDMRLITVIMRADNRDIIFDDTRLLMDFGFTQFEQQAIFSADSFEHSIDLIQRTGQGVLVIGDVEIAAANDIVLPLPINFDRTSITTTIQVADRIVAPISEGFPVGHITLEHEGHVIGQVELYTAQAAQQMPAEQFNTLFRIYGTPSNLLSYLSTGTGGFSVLNLLGGFALVLLGILLFGILLILCLRLFYRRKRRRSRAIYMRRRRPVSYTSGSYRYK